MLAFSAQLAGFPAGLGGRFDLYEFTTDIDIVNVAFAYLNLLGWYVSPGTRTASTARYEFVLLNRDTGKRAVRRLGRRLPGDTEQRSHHLSARAKWLHSGVAVSTSACREHVDQDR